MRPNYQGGNREVFANVAASRLIWALGFETTHALPLNLQCEGCPENPMTGEGAAAQAFLPGPDPGVPRQTAADSLPNHDRDQGWSWRELDEAIRGLPPGRGTHPAAHAFRCADAARRFHTAWRSEIRTAGAVLAGGIDPDEVRHNRTPGHLLRYALVATTRTIPRGPFSTTAVRPTRSSDRTTQCGARRSFL